MIITNNPNKIKINQRNYEKIVFSINFSSIVCSQCSNHDWSVHSRYYRTVDFYNRSIKIKIIRIICSSCGKTHAILIEDMIPFSCLSYSDIIEVFSSYTPGIVYSSHFYFLKAKYFLSDILNYHSICTMNKRNCSLIFIST